MNSSKKINSKKTKRKTVNSANKTSELGRNLIKGIKKSSYSDIFREKLKYVSPDIGLSHNKDGSYSNFYKDGLKINPEEIDKSNSNISSLRNSIIISHSEKNMTVGNSPNKKIPSSPLKKSLLKNNNNGLLNSPEYRNENNKGKNSEKNHENGYENYFITFNRIKNNKEEDSENNDIGNEKKNKEEKERKKNNIDNLLSGEKGKKKNQKIKKIIDNDKEKIKNNSEKKILKSENKEKNNLFRKSNQNKNNKAISSPIKKGERRNSNGYKSNDEIIKCNGLINEELTKKEKNINEIKEVDEEDETDNLGNSFSHKKGLFSLIKNSNKKINFYKKNSSELNSSSKKNNNKTSKNGMNGKNIVNTNKKNNENYVKNKSNLLNRVNDDNESNNIKNKNDLIRDLLSSGKKLFFGNEMNKIFKKSNSFENISKPKKDFELSDSEKKQFLKKSKSFDFSFNYNNFEQIKEILGDKSRTNNQNKKSLNKNNSNNKRNIIKSKGDLHNEERNNEMTRTNTNINMKTNQNENEKNQDIEESNIRNIFKRGKNANNLTKKIVNSLINSNDTEKNKSVLNKRKYTNINEKDNSMKKLSKNSSDIPRRNIQSFVLRGGKKIGSDSSTISYIDSMNSDFGKNNNLLNETTEKINNFINQIREKSKHKNNILKIYKEQSEKQLQKLKIEKKELKEKKNILNQEKLIKYYQIGKNENEKKREKWKNSHNKILSINLSNQITNEYENNNSILTKRLSKAKSDLNILSEPIYTKKQSNFSSEKNSYRRFSENKKELINLDNCNNQNSVNNINTILRKSESFIINSYYLKNTITERNTNFLEIMKEDMKDFKKKKFKESYSLTTLRKTKRKNYIMPVNSLEDVIQIKDAYINLSANLNVNKIK